MTKGMKQAIQYAALCVVMLCMTVGAAAADNDAAGGTKTEFTWGAAMGGSTDLTCGDMSTIDFEMSAGLRRGWISFLGAGVEADIMVGNSNRSFPFFAELRTSFTERPTVVFMDVKMGACLNYIENIQQTGLYSFAGAGFNLAHTEKVSSYITVGYTFRQRRNINTSETTIACPDLHYATVKFGVCF